MSTSASAIAIERPGQGRRQRQLAPTSVGDYVGQSAAHGAQAVRRAGLRPGLDRAFGNDPELTGTIVAQDPSAGSAVARNAKVTLYVAAPGSAQIPETAELGVGDGDQKIRAAGQAEDSGRTVLSRGTQTRARRARKPRPAWGPGADERTTASSHAAQAPVGALEPLPEVGDRPPAASEPGPLAASTPPHTERDARVANMFASPIDESAPWRRTYPRKPIRFVARLPITWARSHPVLAPLAAAMIAVWIAVAVAGSTAPATRPAQGTLSPRARGIAATPSARPAKSPAWKPSRRARSVRGRRRRSPRSAAGPAAAGLARRPVSRPGPRKAWVSPGRASAKTASPRIGTPSESPVSVAHAAPSASVSTPSSGGPFSP